MSLYLGTTPIADTGSSKATTSLSNLTSTGANIANWSNNVTNCITEIPQDIKLELNNGALTLKAGSKVYVPNGSGTYNAVTVASDIGSGSISGISADYMFFLNPSKTGMAGGAVTGCYSGTTEPTTPSTGYFWYDTTNNSVKRWSGSAWVDGFSLPFCIITSGASSIKQVFNGFGYIGSTIFALPSVKGLIPNGRNADGTLRNIEFTLNGVQTVSLTTQTFTNRNFVLRNGDMGFSSVVYYDAVNNTNYNFSAYMIAATGSVSSGKITSFTPKTAFHAVDYNDSSTISGWSMPSSRYIDLTLGASGASYTAPANGWVFLRKYTITANRFIGLYMYDNIGVSSMTYSPVANKDAAVFIPVKKGQVFSCYYDMDGGTAEFRFVYAEGEENV